MMRLICYSVVMLLMAACSTKKVVPVVVVKDSVVYRERVVKVRDTVSIEIPLIVERNVTADTCSYLKNVFAESWASVDSSGLLHHSLSTIAQRVEAETDREIVYRDSIAYRDREVKVPYPVEKKLSWWQRFRLDSYILLLLVVVVENVWLWWRKRRS